MLWHQRARVYDKLSKIKALFMFIACANQQINALGVKLENPRTRIGRDLLDNFSVLSDHYFGAPRSNYIAKLCVFTKRAPGFVYCQGKYPW